MKTKQLLIFKKKSKLSNQNLYSITVKTYLNFKAIKVSPQKLDALYKPSCCYLIFLQTMCKCFLISGPVRLKNLFKSVLSSGLLCQHLARGVVPVHPRHPTRNVKTALHILKPFFLYKHLKVLILSH